MNQNLDSRVLNYGECYGMKFSHSGKAIYQVHPYTGASLPADEDCFSITVRDTAQKSGSEQQHNIVIRKQDGRLVAEPEHLEISKNDVVLWHAANAEVHGFVISGEGPKDEFDSAAITTHSVYTHPFGNEGVIDWIDANGSGLHGTIVVKSPKGTDKKSQQKWLAQLETPSLITISGDKASPQKLEIITGQTVVWAIEKAAGISITDARLVAPKPAPVPDKPARKKT